MAVLAPDAPLSAPATEPSRSNRSHAPPAVVPSVAPTRAPPGSTSELVVTVVLACCQTRSLAPT
jgi:hypothetical protein